MKGVDLKKLILPNIPYALFVYLFDKVAQAARLAPGTDISAKVLHIGQGFTAAFENALPSFHPLDLLIGVAGAVVIRIVIYVKGKNAKKYRKGMGISNIEITNDNIKAFESTAKKYGIDFSLKKVKGDQPRYLVFFKGRDAGAMTAAFREFSAKKLKRNKKPGVRKALAAAKEKSKQLNQSREKVKNKDRGRAL